MNIANNIKSTIPQIESVREYLKFVEERFRSADKSLAGLKVKANKVKKKKALDKAQQDANKEHKADTCHFCNKEGHYQKDCLKRKVWFEKKGTISAFGFLTIQTTNPNKDFLFMGNRMKAPIEGIGTYRLIMETGRHLDLLQTHYVPSVSRNLISLSRLDVSGFDLKFGNGCFNLYKNAIFYGSGFLSDGLYKLKLDIGIFESLLTIQHNVGIKRSSLDESSAYL
uniref:Uncharacterized protein LOC104242748 n=1 Tax=Nicotiana sylvestris TaxID=4096 RepID=A0A1U7XVV3_NICSY|nr:PREDICTED: uncharacterized protein LOC104242748 [Nicotiana sylvestris]